MMDVKHILRHLFPDGVLAVSPVGDGGSNRQFFRVATKEGSLVLMLDADRSSLSRYIRIAHLLSRSGVAVPRIFQENVKLGFVLLEDVGDESLSSFVKRAGVSGRRNIYLYVIDVLVAMEKDVDTSSLPIFGRENLFQETEYFAREFIEKTVGLSVPGGVWGDFSRLVRLVSSTPVGFMHRDFQSENIFIKSGAIRLLDFQSACRGPAFYDVASLLFDPYVFLPIPEIDFLFRYYQTLSQPDFPFVEEAFYLTCIQRLLQALGAYGYLGNGMGKTRFLGFISPALSRLQYLLEKQERFEELLSLVKLARLRWEELLSSS